jgi:hypothetical protein
MALVGIILQDHLVLDSLDDCLLVFLLIIFDARDKSEYLNATNPEEERTLAQ